MRLSTLTGRNVRLSNLLLVLVWMITILSRCRRLPVTMTSVCLCSTSTSFWDFYGSGGGATKTCVGRGRHATAVRRWGPRSALSITLIAPEDTDWPVSQDGKACVWSWRSTAAKRLKASKNADVTLRGNSFAHTLPSRAISLLFTALCHAIARCLSVCLSHSGLVSKWLNVTYHETVFTIG